MRKFLSLTVLLVLLQLATALHASLRSGASTASKHELTILVREKVNVDKDSWRTAKYFRRPGGDSIPERFSVHCASKACDIPTFEWKRAEKDLHVKDVRVSQDFTLDLNPTFLADFGSGEQDTEVRLLTENSVIVYPRTPSSPIKAPMVFYKTDRESQFLAEGLGKQTKADYFIQRVHEFLDLFLDELKTTAEQTNRAFDNGAEVTKAFYPAASSLQHRLKVAIKRGEKEELPMKEMELLQSLPNSLCDTFNEMAAWDHQMSEIFARTAHGPRFTDTQTFGRELEKMTAAATPDRKFSNELGGALKSGTKAGVGLLMKTMASHVKKQEHLDPVEKQRQLGILNDPNNRKVLADDLYNVLEKSKAMHALDNKVVDTVAWGEDVAKRSEEWFGSMAKSIEGRLRKKDHETEIKKVIESGGPDSPRVTEEDSGTTCAGTGAELREKGLLAPGEENVVKELEKSYSRGLKENQFTFGAKPKVSGLLDKISVFTNAQYLTNYTSTKVHFNVDVNNVLMSNKASLDINTGIHHAGVSKDGRLHWTAGANARLSLGGVMSDNGHMTKAHLNTYVTAKKFSADGKKSFSTGFFVSRDINTPTGSIVKGSVLDRYHHEFSYTNEENGLSISAQNTLLKKNGVGDSIYSGVQIKKKGMFGVDNLSGYASAGYEAHRNAGDQWKSGGATAKVGVTFSFRI